MRLFEFALRLMTEYRAFNVITEECSEILELYRQTNKVLYRGQSFTPGYIYEGESSINRRPRDMPIEASQAIDHKLKAAGFTALRSNSIFCSNSKGQAGEYGPPYIIFPKNGFSFTYSKLRDFVRDYWPPDFDDDSAENYSGKDLANYKADCIIHQPLNDFIGDNGFTNADLDRALTGNPVEVYIHGAYVAVYAGASIRTQDFLLKLFGRRIW